MKKECVTRLGEHLVCRLVGKTAAGDDHLSTPWGRKRMLFLFHDLFISPGNIDGATVAITVAPIAAECQWTHLWSDSVGPNISQLWPRFSCCTHGLILAKTQPAYTQKKWVLAGWWLADVGQTGHCGEFIDLPYLPSVHYSAHALGARDRTRHAGMAAAGIW